MKIIKQKRIRYKYKVLRSDEGSVFAQGSYCLEYKKDTVVKAIPGTLGIFVFTRRKDAEYWINDSQVSKYYLTPIIKRVIPIGRGKLIKRMCGGQKEFTLTTYYNDSTYRSLQFQFPPYGTVCYPAVRVVD